VACYVAVARDGVGAETRWEQAARLHPVVNNGWQPPPCGGSGTTDGMTPRRKDSNGDHRRMRLPPEQSPQGRAKGWWLPCESSSLASAQSTISAAGSYWEAARARAAGGGQSPAVTRWFRSTTWQHGQRDDEAVSLPACDLEALGSRHGHAEPSPTDAGAPSDHQDVRPVPVHAGSNSARYAGHNSSDR
jgi:hypothetical protein